MSIDSLRDGFVTLCLNTSLNYYRGACQIVAEGQYIPPATGGPTPDVPMIINSVNDCDILFGPGSILSESLKKMFLTAAQGVQISAIPRADAEGAIAAVYTFTITGTATSPGVFPLFMLDQEYSIEFAVSIGDTAEIIAANLVAALPYNFPYSAVATGGVVVFTALNAGTCGNYLTPIYNWAGLQNYTPLGITVACVRTVAGSIDPAPIDYEAAIGGCCYSVYVLLGSDPKWQLAMEQWIRAQWSCNVPSGANGAAPQCFGQGYTYNVGSLGQVLAGGDNAEVFNRLAYPVNDANPPWLLVAAYGALTALSACVSPELAIQGPVDGVLNAITRPTNCSEPWSYSARLVLAAAGFVVWGPLTNAASQLTYPYIYNDITNSLTDTLGRPNATWTSTTTRRWAASFSDQLAQFLDGSFNGLSAFSDGTQIKPGIFGTTMNMMRAKIIAWLNGVSGSLISALQNTDTQVILTSSLDTSPPCQGIPGNYELQLTVQPGVRINNIATTILPQLLTNCSSAAYTKAQQLAS